MIAKIIEKLIPVASTIVEKKVRSMPALLKLVRLVLSHGNKIIKS